MQVKMWILVIVKLACLACLLDSSAFGQYKQLSKLSNEEGAYFIYEGSSEWLIKQSKSEFSKVHSAELVRHDISSDELGYVATFPNLMFLRLGDVTDPVQLDNECIHRLTASKKLKKLVVCKVDLSDSDLESISKIKTLLSLDLLGEGVDGREFSSQLLTDAGIRHLASLKNLEHLAIRGAHTFSDESVIALSKLPALKYLEIYSNDFTDRVCNAMADLKQLETLVLRGQITDRGIADLASVQTISSLRLSSLALTPECLFHCSKFANLKVLRLSISKVEDASLASLSNCPKLRELLLPYTQFTASNFRAVSGVQSLEHLDVSSTVLSPPAITAFEAMPRLSEVNFSSASDQELVRVTNALLQSRIGLPNNCYD